MRVVVIAMTALLLAACGQSDRQAAPMSSDISSASALPSSPAESQEAVPAESSTGGDDSAEDATATPQPDVEQGLSAGEAAEPPLAAVNAFVGDFDLSGEITMRGQFREISENPALYELIGCTFDCRTGAFALPLADGPLTQIASGPGKVKWLFTEDGKYPSSKPSHVYPGQVYFTAAQEDDSLTLLKDLGFVEIPLGGMVGSGIRSFNVPASWPTPVKPYVGELRLFPVGAKLPAVFIPADGRTIAKQTELGNVLGMARFPEVNGGFTIPALAPVNGYQWAIATRGVFPAA